MGKKIITKAGRELPKRESKFIGNAHFWIITTLIVCVTFLYYAGQTPLTGVFPFNHIYFTGIFDIFRTILFALVVYAAWVFRVRGSLIVSFISLIVVLPRAFLFSPYPDPALRALLSVVASASVGLLIATRLNQIENERKARAELSDAYHKLEEYHQRLKDSQEQLIQAEKLTALGQLAASIAHEVNNPIAGVLIYIQLMQKKVAAGMISKEEALDYLSKIDLDLNRSARLVRDLLDFARQSPPALRMVDLNEVVGKSFDLVVHLAGLRGIEVIKEFDPCLPKIMADFDQLRQVCTNLILNAVQAMSGGGKLTLRTSVDGNQVKIEVTDTGFGIPPENMQKLFTPFFTTKQEVKGVGLGLAVSYGIVQRHHGRIAVQSKVGEGSTFAVYLPLHHSE